MFASFLGHRRFYFGHTFALGYAGKPCFDALAEGIKPALHAPHALEKTSVNQGGDWFAIFIDDNAVMAKLDLIQHFAKILSERDCIRLGDHRSLLE